MCIDAPIPPVESKLRYPLGSYEGTDADGNPVLKTKVKLVDFITINLWTFIHVNAFDT